MTYISLALRDRVRQHFRELCAYCHTAQTLAVTTFEIEHIIPQSVGGKTEFDNLCLACPTCNRHKAARQTALDPETQTERSLFHPHQQIWNEHFVWQEGGSQLQGLTPNSRATIHLLKMNRPQLIKIRQLWIKLNEHPPEGDLLQL
ncbi:HNH endonuclease [Spirulina sp. CCNP1310]|uniref:HNH endonuclease n=1 Tax=Spirulina sp. CCNP1310 TaxID=3110249 RepID=UPI002B21F7C9|nr:HNH endonuclease [Spirulina sp. CCNP1310]MEA5418026.1 HNH endonuclease [Spirulina sp. CCNP1310]